MKARPGSATWATSGLIAEVGRGGMGVVYEAVQRSLNRRVALKVLPFAAAMDPTQLRRFQTEALAAAQLHHTHIVPVYSVGCERGVHYYAMQFIEGQTLAQAIAERRRLRSRRRLPLAESEAARVDPPKPLTEVSDPRRLPTPHNQLAPPRPPAAASTSERPPRWASRRPRRSTTRTRSASCTATSSRPTSCWTSRATSGSRISAWPGSRTTPA